jgi:hypothetical protein
VFKVYQYRRNLYTKSFANLEDLANFSNTFTEKYRINHESKIESIEKYNKRRELEGIKLKQIFELEKIKFENEKKELEIKKEKVKEFENIL